MKKLLKNIVLLSIGAVVGASSSILINYQNVFKDKDAQLTQQQVRAMRNRTIIDVFSQWLQIRQEGKRLAGYFEANGYYAIAIYGMHFLGEALLRELKNTDIKVKYAIDKNAKNICVLPDGIDLDKYFIMDKPVFGSKECIELLFAANMNESKGAIDAIKATEILVKKYKMNVHLTLAGDDTSYIRKCFRYIGARSYMDFVGFQPDLTELRRNADIVFMCSRSEALGRVTLESMLGRCLVIGANAGATPELIDNGITGYLYEANDVYQLANITREAIINKEKSREIIEDAQKYVLNNFGSKKYARDIIKIYEKASKKRRYSL